MCGIVGYVGREQAAPILLDGLRRLEYRGYDSAGLAVVSPEGNLQVVKSAGRLQALADKTHDGADLTGTMGIGHTRWATHGEPSDINSHPHVSEDGRIAVVHNGIVENYLEIKQFLQSKGVTFQSETDSEVVAQLLEYYYEGDILKATFRVLDRIEGAYALGIICADAPDRLIAARKMSPLVLGYGKDCSLIASDVTALIAKTREVCYMDDDEVAVLSRDGIEVFNAMGDPIEKEHSFVDWDISAAEKGGYPHFMFKEILEQPEAVTKTIAPRIRDGRIVLDDLDLSPEYVRSVSKIYVIACGSSYHVGVVGKYNLEKLLRKPVEVVLASEFRYCDPIVDDHTLALVISQSGETIDTLSARPSPGSRTTCSTHGPAPRSPLRRRRRTRRRWPCSTSSAFTLPTRSARSRRSATPRSWRSCSASRRKCSAFSTARTRSSTMPRAISITSPCSSSAGTSTTRSASRAA